MNITESMPEEERKRYQVVRRDSGYAIPGTVLRAEEETGYVKMVVGSGDSAQQVDYALGSNAIAVIPQHRYGR